MHSTDTCFACRAPLKPAARFCGKCGTPRQQPPAFRGTPEAQSAADLAEACPNCGKHAAVAAGKFCRTCGHRLRLSGPGDLAAADGEEAGAPVPALEGQPRIQGRSRIGAVALSFSVLALTLAAGGTGYWLARASGASPARAVAQQSAPTPQAPTSVDRPEQHPAALAAPLAETVKDSAEETTVEMPARRAEIEPSRRPSEAAAARPDHPALRPDRPVEQRRRRTELGVPARAIAPSDGNTSTRIDSFEESMGSTAAAAVEAPPPPAPSEQVARGRTASQAEASLGAARTIDQLFQQRITAECEAGLLGFVCREKVRFGLCRDRWTPRAQPGMTACRVIAQQGPPGGQ